GHERSIAVLAQSPNGFVVATAGASGSVPSSTDLPHCIRFWNVATGKQVATLSGHGADVTSLAYSIDGSQIVSGLADTTALIWDVPPAARNVKFARDSIPAGELDTVWKDLASTDGKRGQTAVLRLVQDSTAALKRAEA